ncbi:MAG: EAL domain-containing protein, partial [Blastococcus sp.]
SLTADVGTDRRAAAIVEHTVALAHALGLRLVAEGVEDAATGEVLARLGCDVAQGFAIARPMPVPDFLAWLDARRGSGLRRTSAPLTFTPSEAGVPIPGGPPAPTGR